MAKGLNSSLILPLQYQNKMICRIKHWWMHSLTSAWQFLNEPWILLCDKRAHNLEFQIMDFWYWHREKYMTNIAGQRSIEIRLSTWHCAFLSIKGLASITGVHILRMTPNLEGSDRISIIGKAQSCIKMASPRHVYLHYPANIWFGLGQHSTDTFE